MLISKMIRFTSISLFPTKSVEPSTKFSSSVNLNPDERPMLKIKIDL